MPSKKQVALRAELRALGYAVVRGDKQLQRAARAAGAFTRHGRLWLEQGRLDDVRRAVDAARPKCEHVWEPWDCGCMYGCSMCSARQQCRKCECLA